LKANHSHDAAPIQKAYFEEVFNKHLKNFDEGFTSDDN
jgi:hypothetical protein